MIKRLYHVVYRFSMYASEYRSSEYDSRAEAINFADKLLREMIDVNRGGWVKIICTSCVWENGHNV